MSDIPTTEIRNVEIRQVSSKAYLVYQKIRNDEVEVWVPQSVVHYKRTHPREEEKPQQYNLGIADWWLEKNECPLQ